MIKILKKQSSLLLSTVLAVSLTLGGCQNKADDPAPAASSKTADGVRQGGTLVVGFNGVTVLDPTREGGWETFQVNRQMLESLVTEDLSKSASEVATPPLKPGLAESWELSEGGKKYTFHLRQGIKFHDGTDFNAAAVEFNIRRAWDPKFEYYDKISAGKMSLTYQYLQSIETPDDHTIVLSFKAPFSPFLRMLAQGSWGTGLILSPAAVKKYGNDGYADHPVGTGPFKFVSHTRDEKIELERNDDYWGEKAHLDKVVYRTIQDPAARITALQNGEVDLINVPTPDSVATLKENGFNVYVGPLPDIMYYSFNFNNPYFKDQRVREAFIRAIDREGLAKNLLKGTATAAYNINSPGNEAYDPGLKDYDYDPEKAKALLAEAGYPNGFETTVQTFEGSVSEWVQADLAKVGIKLKVQTMDFVSYLTAWADMKPDVGLNIMEWGFVTSYWLYIVAHSQSNSNVGKYNSPAYDAAVEKAISDPDPANAIASWKEANRIVSEDAAFAPLYSNTVYVLAGKNVQDFVQPAQMWYDLNKVWLKK